VGKIIAIDHGDRRIGLAISDELKMIAFPYKTIDIKKDRFYIDTICKILNDSKVCCIIVGWPISMSGNITSQTSKVENFIKRLEKQTSIDIVKIDERLTSAIAKRKMLEAGKKQKDNKGEADMLAASIILQDYLDNA